MRMDDKARELRPLIFVSGQLTLLWMVTIDDVARERCACVTRILSRSTRIEPVGTFSGYSVTGGVGWRERCIMCARESDVASRRRRTERHFRRGRHAIE